MIAELAPSPPDIALRRGVNPVQPCAGGEALPSTAVGPVLRAGMTLAG